jgi:hypothetical protein
MFRHHAFEHRRLPLQLPAEQGDQLDLVRHREPLEILSDIEHDVLTIQIAQMAAFSALLHSVPSMSACRPSVPGRSQDHE